MLRINIYYDPFGNIKERETIGVLEIWNDGSGSREVGNYRYRFLEMNSSKPTKILGEIKDFPRLEQDAIDLLRLVLTDSKELTLTS